MEQPNSGDCFDSEKSEGKKGLKLTMLGFKTPQQEGEAAEIQKAVLVTGIPKQRPRFVSVDEGEEMIFEEQTLPITLNPCCSSGIVVSAAIASPREAKLESSGKRVLSERDLPIKKRHCSRTWIKDGVSTNFGFSIELRKKISQLADNDPKLVIQKKLTASDVNPSQGRLSMPGKQTSLFLNNNEKRVIESKDKRGHKGPHHREINVEVLDPSLQTRDMLLRKWHYNNNWSYVLVSGWREVVKANELNKGDTVQVWSFRKEGKLGFALLNLGRASNLDVSQLSPN